MYCHNLRLKRLRNLIQWITKIVNRRKLGETALNFEVRVKHIQANNVKSVAKFFFEIFSVNTKNAVINKDACFYSVTNLLEMIFFNKFPF